MKCEVMKYVKAIAAVVALFFAFTVCASAYSVGAAPPSGLAGGAPYLKVSIGGQLGYIYPTTAQLEWLAIKPNDELSVSLSGVTSPAGTGAQNVMSFPFFASSSGDSALSYLRLYLEVQSPPSTSTLYPVVVHWGWSRGNATTYFGGSVEFFTDPIIVVDTNIPMFSPRNETLSMQSPVGVILLVFGSLYVAHFLLEIIMFIGRYRKGANGY